MEPRLITGDCRTILSGLNQRSVHCVVTSPPYWGLRDYGVDDQIGLEETVDEYVRNLVDVFDKVRRVLRDDGTLWLNLGDAYTSGGRSGHGTELGYLQETNAGCLSVRNDRPGQPRGLKPKDLIGLPWRVAFALQADGWYLRSDIIWAKPNPMPSSVKDRPTTAHEYVFLLSKSERYYYDHEAIAEDAVGTSGGASFGPQTKIPAGWDTSKNGSHGKIHKNGREPAENQRRQSERDLRKPKPQSRKYERPDYEKRNKRDVWTIPVQSYHEAHFATFPEKLVEPCILAGCPEEGTVLDPFSGSGTTGKVAIQYGRNYIGIEVNPEYTAIAEKRFDQKRLFA